MSEDTKHHRTCVNCRCVKRHEQSSGPYYECRKRSPIASSDCSAWWPVVKTDDWCGDFDRVVGWERINEGRV